MRTSIRFIALSLALSAAPKAWAADKLNVVTTLSDLGKIAEAVGGDKVQVSAIVAGIQDPHFVDPKPSYVVKVRDADLFLVSGLELEIGWVPPLLEGARNPRVNIGAPGYIDCSRNIPVIERPSGEVTRAQGDAHPLGNPHYLLDPLNGAIVATTINEAFVRAAPQHAAYFNERAKAFIRALHEAMFGKTLVDEVSESKLDRLARSGELEAFLEGRGLLPKLGGWMQKMRPLKGKQIVFYHRSFSYFFARFGIIVSDYVELRPGIQPGPGHLAELVETMRKQKIPLLGTHGFYDEKIARLVAEKAGAKLVVFPIATGGAHGADDYSKLFDVIVELMTTNMGG